MTTTHSEFENSTLQAGQRQDSTLEIQAPDGSVMVLSDGDQGELLRLTPAR